MMPFEQAFFLFHKGGIVMYPLLVCSIAVVAIVIERSLVFRQTFATLRIWSVPLAEAAATNGWNRVTQVSSSCADTLPPTLAPCLTAPDADIPYLEHMLERTAAQIVSAMRQRLSYLDTIVTLAPLLGLLGTVIGMIQSFSILTLKAGQHLAITGGIGEALIATAAGLCVAIMALAAHSYLSHKIETLISEWEEVSNILISAAMKRDRHEA